MDKAGYRGLWWQIERMRVRLWHGKEWNDRDYLRNVAMGLAPTPFNRARDTEDDQDQEVSGDR